MSDGADRTSPPPPEEAKPADDLGARAAAHNRRERAELLADVELMLARIEEQPAD